MKEQNGLEAFNVFAADATSYYDAHYGKDAQSPGAENYVRGFAPLETLPATWYNSILRNLTRQAQQTYLLVSSIYDELKYIVEQGGQTLSDEDNHQLLTALQDVFTLNVATGTTLGGVLSSVARNKVLVNADGTMTPNALSDWDRAASVRDEVDAARLNADTAELHAQAAQSTADTAVSNAATAQSTANTAVTNAATAQSTANTAISRLDGLASVATSGSYTDLSNKPSYTLGYSKSGSTVTINLLQNGTSISSISFSVGSDTVTRATYAQYLVPSSTSTSTACTSDGSNFKTTGGIILGA